MSRQKQEEDHTDTIESPAIDVFQSGLKILKPQAKDINIAEIFKEASD